MNIEKITFTKLLLLFIPVSYASYLIHEFGHWIIGEALGNNMVYSLNNVWPKGGHYIDADHEVLVIIGGPVFTIILSILFYLIIEKYRTIYAYAIVFFQMFFRFFSLVFGGFSKQDESRISAILNLGTYTVAIIVLLLLFLIVFKASKKLRINLKDNSFFLIMSTLGAILVITTYGITSK
ncbi:MAG: hypothetical protein IZT55_00705 [Anaerolineae bacterium]|nr:hypothetical protein [Anaerolineae bacterium]